MLIKNINKNDLKTIYENFALLFTAAFVGLIVAGFAQLFIIIVKNLYSFIFENNNFTLNLDIGNISRYICIYMLWRERYMCIYINMYKYIYICIYVPAYMKIYTYMHA